MSVVSATCYELLGVPVHASRPELARAWSDRRATLLGEAGGRSSEELEALCARLDEAFSILSHPERSKRYRAYLALQSGASAPLRPEDLLHPIVAEWSARSTDIPAPAAPAPGRAAPSADDPIPAGPPPWTQPRRLRRAPVEALVEEAVQALAGPLDEPPISHDLPDEDSVSTFDEWGSPLEESEYARTVPAGPAAAPAPKPDLGSLTRPPNRRPITAMPPIRTRPATSLPSEPWSHDQD